MRGYTAWMIMHLSYSFMTKSDNETFKMIKQMRQQEWTCWKVFVTQSGWKDSWENAIVQDWTQKRVFDA